MELSGKERFLFVHAGDTSFTSRPNKSLDSEIRRHVMVKIGKSRRKRPKKLPFVIREWQSTEALATQPRAHNGRYSKNEDNIRMPALSNDLVLPNTVALEPTTQYAVMSPVPSVLHALSDFEKEWGEDSYSAYGFTLMMMAGKNASSSASSTETFWFPFAFRQSAFLWHYRQIFISPDLLVPLYRASARRLQFLALERSLTTIQCIESTIASCNVSSSLSDKVLSAVLAIVCYNLINLDFDQAMVHVKGMRMIVEARGGWNTLEANPDLMAMISWMDITVALVCDTKPLFPLCTAMPSANLNHQLTLDTLPAPLFSLMNGEIKQDTRLTSVMSCIADLNALATVLRVELATNGDAIWDDEERMGFLINPVAYHLLQQQPAKAGKRVQRSDMISEAIRLGSTIWIIEVKRRCRSYPGTARSRVSALLNILSGDTDLQSIWSKDSHLQIVRLWLLILCGIGETSDQDHELAMRMIVGVIKKHRLASWKGIMVDVRRMPWLDIFESRCATLGQQIKGIFT